MNQITMSILVGLLAALIVLFIYLVTRPTKISVRDRLSGGEFSQGQRYVYSKSSFGNFYKKSMSKVVSENFIYNLGATLGVNIPVLEEQILTAGLQDSISAMEIVVLKFLAFIALFCFAVAFVFSKSIYFLIAGLIAFAALFFIPQSKISDAIKKRNSDIIAELPIFIEQVYLCISAGATLQDALLEVANVTSGELGKAFRNVFVNAAFASRWSDEAVRMAQELKIEPLEDFVNDIVIADSKGINIEDTLKTEVEHINKINRSRIMGEVSALESKLTPLQIIFCMVPMLGIVMLPIIIQVMETL